MEIGSIYRIYCEKTLSIFSFYHRNSMSVLATFFFIVVWKRSKNCWIPNWFLWGVGYST